ncbi:hypothetical protein NKI61_16390 [Mesorhizobium sp. M0514]|uniref:hypothetical protein n=1 Tax=unclassified Mesorhizobium TaxID=325217 RepID=UPI0003CE9378|nr:hypothetical protein [Mesorhizobium sp. LNJC391B00]ESY26732.1 hypothetical protein X749_25255 [Mesorhizobium sp. LNJC391B00]
MAIALLVKKKDAEQGVWHTDIWGSRLSKYQECAEAEISTIEWSRPKPFSSYFMLSAVDWTGWEEYGQWWQIADSLSAASDKRQIFSGMC